jgi:hypothetical protein
MAISAGAVADMYRGVNSFQPVLQVCFIVLCVV